MVGGFWVWELCRWPVLNEVPLPKGTGAQLGGAPRAIILTRGSVARRTYSQLWLVCQIQHFLDQDSYLTIIVHVVLTSHLEYCNVLHAELLYVGLSDNKVAFQKRKEKVYNNFHWNLYINAFVPERGLLLLDTFQICCILLQQLHKRSLVVSCLILYNIRHLLPIMQMFSERHSAENDLQAI